MGQQVLIAEKNPNESNKQKKNILELDLQLIAIFVNHTGFPFKSFFVV